MTTLRTGFPIPFYAMGGDPFKEDPKAIFGVVDFSLSTQWTGDLLEQMQTKRIQSIRTIYFDLINCANNVTLFWPQTQQRMILPRGGWGYIPVVVSDKADFVLTGTSPDIFRMHLINKDIDPIIYDPNAGFLPVAAITVSASPRLIGRFSAGAGPAEEISLTAPFSIAGGAFSAQAAAQYNIMARRSAGAGAFEDSTRLQANIPGLELANVFDSVLGGQEIRSPANVDSLLLTVVDNGASGPFLVCFHESASPAVNDVIANWVMRGRDSGGNLQNYAQMRTTISDPTSGSEDAVFSILTAQAGVVGFRLFVGGGIYTRNASDLGDDTFYAKSAIRVGQFTVATLPAAATIGAGGHAYVTDALAPAFGAAVVGGGAVGMVVFSTGAAWNVG